MRAGNFIQITLRHGCSPVNLLHIFRTPFPMNTSGRLVLIVKKGEKKPKVENNFTADESMTNNRSSRS